MSLTLARYLDPGRPPSRANAHNIREAVAKRPTVAKNWVTIMTQAYGRQLSTIGIAVIAKKYPVTELTMAVAPLVDPTA